MVKDLLVAPTCRELGLSRYAGPCTMAIQYVGRSSVLGQIDQVFRCPLCGFRSGLCPLCGNSERRRVPSYNDPEPPTPARLRSPFIPTQTALYRARPPDALFAARARAEGIFSSAASPLNAWRGADSVKGFGTTALNNAPQCGRCQPHGLRNNLPTKAADFCLANA